MITLNLRPLRVAFYLLFVVPSAGWLFLFKVPEWGRVPFLVWIGLFTFNWFVFPKEQQ